MKWTEESWVGLSWADTCHRWDIRAAMEHPLTINGTLVGKRGPFWMLMYNVLVAVALASENTRGEIEAVYW